ncbi:MAG: hypothetical protein IPH88_00235 [Bacteroidales bacterium]|nr:hypothetical protein [Bacteroidales bacterium]
MPQVSMGRDIVMTHDNCYFATSSNSAFDPGVSMKIDQRGYIRWEVPYGGFSTKKTSDNGFVIASCQGYQDASIRKIDSDGNPEWYKLYGGYQQDEFHSIIQTSDLGFLACGFTMSHGDSTIYIVKTDAGGNEQWTRSYYTYENNGVANDLLEHQGNYYIAGHTYDDNYNHFLYLTKLNNQGIQLWSKLFPYEFASTALKIAPDGNLMMTGSDVLMKLDLNGEIIWVKNLDPSLRVFAIDNAPDGGFVLSGSKTFNYTRTYNVLLKTDSLGESQWVKTYPGAYDDYWGTFEAVINANSYGYVACGYSIFENSNTRLHIIKTDSYGDCLLDIAPLEPSAEGFFPNPTSGSISTKGRLPERLELYSISGKLLLSCQSCSDMDLEGLPSGIYMLKRYFLLMEHHIKKS